MKHEAKNLHSIAIIGCFFGKFPQYVDLWLKSCSFNPTVNWLVFTDKELHNTPPNVKLIRTTLNDIRILAENKLGFPVKLESPYKLCDFKPIYGAIFAEHLKDYDFWGFCDFDLVFGDIRKFITADILDKHDKILWFGHLTLYRNAVEVNERYQLKGSHFDYKTALSNEAIFAFDEISMNQIYKHHHFPIYYQHILIDIIFYSKHFRGFNIKNYQRQVFFWENGRVYQAYWKNNQIQQKEYLYIHFQKRGFDRYGFDAKKAQSFFITPAGFFEKTPGVIKVEDFHRFNKNPGPLYEFVVMQKYFIKLRFSRLIQRLHGKKVIH